MHDNGEAAERHYLLTDRHKLAPDDPWRHPKYSLITQETYSQLRKEKMIVSRYRLLTNEQIRYLNKIEVKARLTVAINKKKLDHMLNTGELGKLTEEELKLLLQFTTIQLPFRVGAYGWVLERTKMTLEKYVRLTEEKRLNLECRARVARYRQSGISIPRYCFQ